jgi:hypothetical protein
VIDEGEQALTFVGARRDGTRYTLRRKVTIKASEQAKRCRACGRCLYGDDRARGDGLDVWCRS